jgi:hypothetical protein
MTAAIHPRGRRRLPSRARAEPQLAAAIDAARRNGGKLYRHDPLWGPEEFEFGVTSTEDCFPSQTIETLVAQGRMRWSLHESDGVRPIPIEAETVEGAT